MGQHQKLDDAEKKLAFYVLGASAIGAIPVPAASTGIIAENTAMIWELASTLGTKVDLMVVTQSIGVVSAINLVGKQLFIEGARLLAWGTGSVWAAAALSAFGASTAGIQTYFLGRLVIAICRNGGQALNENQAFKIFEDAKSSYDPFVTS